MKILKRIVTAVILCMFVSPSAVYSQNISDLLNTVKDVVEDLTASKDFKIEDIAGTYNYVAPAVSLKGDNALKNIGGSAAASKIEDKLAPFYTRIGFDKLVVTINPDSTFVFSVKNLNLKGLITKNDDGLVFTFDKLKNHPVSCITTKSGDKLSLCFDATKLISVLETVSKVISLDSVKTVVSLLKSYDGLYIGFQLKKTADATSTTTSTTTATPGTESTPTEATTPSDSVSTPVQSTPAKAIGSFLQGLKNKK